MATELSTYYMQQAHRSIGQTRKDGKRPYEVHPMDVRRRVAQVTVNPLILGGADNHDVEEDVAPHKSVIPEEVQEILKLPRRVDPWYYNLESIEACLGPVVATYVFQLTDVYTKANYPHLNRKARKQFERERYTTFFSEVKLIKLADIASNLADDGEVLLGDGSPEVGFNVMFIKEKALCLPYLREGTRENRLLFEQASDILRAQAKKFKVKI